jgi:hypothetical protein
MYPTACWLQEVTVAVTQAVEEPEVRGQEGPSANTPTAFDAAVSEFLGYLKGYRHYSPWTVGAYGIDLREFREFLLEQGGRVPAPAEITRPQVVGPILRIWHETCCDNASDGMRGPSTLLRVNSVRAHRWIVTP